ncbi:MAG: pyridoxal-phosphate dependent enzyme [Candidatus Marinimicrobia bacterium]|nr:pyridoxal-phosphate dependent enzyme [Candidatus Neomarinimicrobiota bacterium]
MQVTINTIRDAHNRISTHILKTPVKSSTEINEIAGAELYFKCENLQRSGSFKIRGAVNAVLSLSDNKANNGVVTVSSGNHGTALSLAAKIRGINATVVLPKNALPYKRNLIENLGAKIVECEARVESREKILLEVQDTTGATVIHPYNDYQIMSGQGTVALEFLEQKPDLDMVLVPIGGGGLISGIAVTVSEIAPKINVVGTEPALADDARQSIAKKKLIPSNYPDTVADGLRTSLGAKTYPIILKYVKDIITAQEQNILPTMNLITKTLEDNIEPSSAVPLAALIEHKHMFKDKKVGIIISGGNYPLDY